MTEDSPRSERPAQRGLAAPARDVRGRPLDGAPPTSLLTGATSTSARVSPQRRPVTAVPAGLLALAAASWAFSLHRIRLEHMNDLGLVSALPILFLVSLILVTVSFAIAITHRPVITSRTAILLGAHVVLLCLILYATPAFVEQVPRTSPMWRHLGVADWIDRFGVVDRSIDAYFNWPGFFVFLAALRELTGQKTLAGLAAWVPALSNLLYSLPLFALLRKGLDTRLAWLGVWLFLCTDWIGQDYLSPQGFGYLIYLTIIAAIFVVLAGPSRASALRSSIEVLARRFARRRPLAPRDGVRVLAADPLSRSNSGAVHRALLVVFLLEAFTAVAISHQLTPYAIVFSVAGVSLVGIPTVRALALAMTVIIFVWFTFAATIFLTRFLHDEFRNFGEVQQNVSASLNQRIGGIPQHELVVNLRVLFTVVLWTVALVGVLYRLTRGHRDLPYMVLALAPVLLVALQQYGGEIGLRIYLFSLPGVIFFVTSLFQALVSNRSAWLPALGVGALSVALISLFLFARYGNERLDYFTPSEFAAVERLYRPAPPANTQLITLSPNLPWRWTQYVSYKYTQITDFNSWNRYAHGEITVRPVVKELIGRMRAERSYLILTPAQATFEEYVAGIPINTYVRLKRAVSRSPELRAVYVNRDSGIWTAARPRAHA
jgi:hypothetical protein